MQNRKKSFDKNHVKGWKTSGLSRKTYCEKHGISYHQLLYHLKREQANGENGFIEIPQYMRSAGEAIIEFHLAGGNYLLFPCGTDAELIVKIIRGC